MEECGGTHEDSDSWERSECVRGAADACSRDVTAVCCAARLIHQSGSERGGVQRKIEQKQYRKSKPMYD
jgi:hypothetical protein